MSKTNKNGNNEVINSQSDSFPKPSEPIIQVQNVSKIFHSQHQDEMTALKDFTLNISKGEFVTIVGPSGCGKSTLIRLIAGLISVTNGNILLQDRKVEGLNTQVGYVPQESKLFPWLTLEENVGFGLECRDYSEEERQHRIRHYIELAGLTGFEKHYPAELSGGMAKRASIIRSLAYDPLVILMDEPFGPLDAQTRMILQDELLKIWEKMQQTIIFVTHDLVEAVALADRVVIMTHRPGQIMDIVQVPMDRPRNIFEIHRQKGFDETYSHLWGIFRHELGIQSKNKDSIDQS